MRLSPNAIRHCDVTVKPKQGPPPTGHLGLSLHQLMCDVKAWAEAHMDKLLANRESYDTNG